MEPAKILVAETKQCRICKKEVSILKFKKCHKSENRRPDCNQCTYKKHHEKNIAYSREYHAREPERLKAMSESELDVHKSNLKKWANKSYHKNKLNKKSE